jgi:hypothetical protein
MKRIFPVLATVDGLFLLFAFATGLAKRFAPDALNGIDPLLHFKLGLFSVIGNLGVHGLVVFIYFLGTGRWVKEVALAYGIPDDPLPKLTRDLKRRVYPAAMFGMLVPIAAAAAGMGAMLQEWPWQIHLVLAILTLLVNGWAFVVEYHCVHTNAAVLFQVLNEVDRIRAERGLPTNAEALRQEAAQQAGPEVRSTQY